MGSEYDIMLDEKNDKIWALERELAETKEQRDILAVYVACNKYMHVGCPGCSRMTSDGWCVESDDAICVARVKAWTLAEARKEQDNA